MKLLSDLDVKNKRVLVRVDYNVPLDKSGNVEDPTRILETRATLENLLNRDARVILASHLGRPKGGADPKYSLKPVVPVLEEMLGRPVRFAGDCVGEEAAQSVNSLKPGEVLLLENVRFHPEEEKNGEGFARQLASLADIYVNDAFGAAHRAHASTAGVAKFLPSAAGLLLEKEVRVLSRLLESPRHPYVAILGGAKVSDKIAVLENLLEKVDAVLIGGAMAFTFLDALGIGVGKSPVERDQFSDVKMLFEKYGAKIVLPVDVNAADSPEHFPKAHPVRLEKGRNSLGDLKGLDIGPLTIRKFSEFLIGKMPKTVFWNGPMGMFEVPEFSKGTLEIGRALGTCAKQGAMVVVGGGDSISAVNRLGLAGSMSHLSTGGGASLEFLEGKVLPGIEALANGEPMMKR